MDWKILLLFIFTLTTAATQAAEKASKSSTLQLRGIVSLQVGIKLEPDKNGALVPTLHSNSPVTANLPVRIKTSRAPASVGDFQRVVIESN